MDPAARMTPDRASVDERLMSPQSGQTSRTHIIGPTARSSHFPQLLPAENAASGLQPDQAVRQPSGYIDDGSPPSARLRLIGSVS